MLGNNKILLIKFKCPYLRWIHSVINNDFIKTVILLLISIYNSIIILSNDKLKNTLNINLTKTFNHNIL